MPNYVNIAWEKHRQSVGRYYGFTYIYKAMGCKRLLFFEKPILQVVHRKKKAQNSKKCSNYFPYGMLMPNRKNNTGLYRYGFNGKENDNEIKGDGNSIDYGARMYDPRIGRWFAIDPQSSRYPHLSPYAYVANKPTVFVDPNGEEVDITRLLSEVTPTFDSDGKSTGYRDKNKKEKVRDLFILKSLMDEFSNILGNNVGYTETSDGRFILVAKPNDCKGNCSEVADFTRFLFTKATDPKDALKVVGTDNYSKASVFGNTIYLGLGDILTSTGSLRKNNLNELSLGAAFILLHETMHKKNGADFFTDPKDQLLKSGDGAFKDHPFTNENGESESSKLISVLNRLREGVGLPTRDSHGSITKFNFKGNVFDKSSTNNESNNSLKIPKINAKEIREKYFVPNDK